MEMSAGPHLPGRLRLFLGTAPGTGKTYAMVQEGHRLTATMDVVVVACDVTDASPTARAAAGLERIRPGRDEADGGIDLAGVLARHPQVALVDRLAHPGRWGAVQTLLRAGVDVIATVDVTEIATLSDAVEAITGLPSRHSVPDAVIEGATSIQLVDAAAEEIQRRRTDGQATVDVGRWPRDVETLTSLRQLTLLWLAERLDIDRGPLEEAQDPPAPKAPPYARSGVPTALPRTGWYLAGQPSGWRLWIGWLLALGGPPALTGLLLAPPVHLSLQLIVQLFLALVVLVALLGGLWPAVITAAVSSATLNWFFTPPRRTWIIHDPQDVAAITVFVLIAIAVAYVVHRNVQRTNQALEAQRETEHYGSLATSLLDSRAQLDLLLRQALQVFTCASVTVVQHQSDQAPSVVATARSSEVAGGALRTTREAIDERHDLVLEGPALEPAQRRLLRAYAATSLAILTRLALHASARTALSLERDNLARTALLSAVSHDLRTPLASIKAAASGLLDPTVTFSDWDRRQLLETIDQSSDELDTLIRDLLAVSRLHQGSLVAQPSTFALTEALPSSAWPERVQISSTLSDVTVFADRSLLERILVNLVDNALAHGGSSGVVEVTATSLDDRVHVLVRDHGTGVPVAERSSIFLPFQRRGDSSSGHVGLGLAISRGFMEAMGGTIAAAETPGGGLTIVINLPAGTPQSARLQPA